MRGVLSGFGLFWIITIAYSVDVRRDDVWPPKQLLEWFRPAAEECRQSTGVSEEFIREFDSGEIVDDPTLKCYMFCVFDKLDLVNSKGELFIMRLADHIDSNYNDEVRNIAYQMGRKCLIPPDNVDNCEKAYFYHRCWKERDSKHYFLI